MLVQLEIVPVSGTTHLSDALAKAVQIIDETDVPYVLTPSGTCLEGSWDEVMPVIRRCHERLREDAPHVFTYIRIEDEEGATNKLRSNVSAIQGHVEASGHSLTPELRLS